MGGEWLADWQLTRFRRHPSQQGNVGRVGLWNRTRQQTKLIELLQWIAYLLFSFGAPDAYLSWIGPLAMYLFLMKFTGIPHVEREALAKRGTAYATYQREVPIFFPRILPPKGM